ncbi:MAG TPA: arginine deiminase family protein [Pilimelia sp.]|nr:arginine deiminase family protein [Pilimelia sp.]
MTGHGAALVRRPSYRLPEGLVTYVDRRDVDPGLARLQHKQYRAALVEAGWAVREVAPADDCPDAVFVEDTVVVCDRLAVLARPGAPQRRPEVAGAEVAVRAAGLDVVRIESPGTLDGGDVLQVGTTVYAGRGGRTNADGIRQLRAHLAGLGRTVVAVPLGRVLHLKSAVTALPDGTVLAWPSYVDTEVFPAVRAAPEETGCHVLPLGGDRVLLAASAPRTADLIANLGFTPVVVDIGEFEKLEGCVTCLSVLIPNPGTPG